MPSRPSLLCTGLVIQVGPPGIDPGKAFDLALEVVARRLSGEWGVMPLSENFNDFEVSRWSRRPLPVARAWDLATRLAADRDVASAEPAFRCSGLQPDPDTDLAPYELRAVSLLPDGDPLPCARDNPVWSLQASGIEAAWQLPPPDDGGGRRFGKGVVVAHPDTGYTEHEEIWDAWPGKRRVLASRGYDYEDDDPDARDPLDGAFPGHGTGTASVIMSDHNPSPGSTWVSGAAPRSELIPFRVSDSVIHFDFTNVALAIHEAVDQNAHVISMSLGGPFPSRYLERAVDRAIERGIIVLAAAGNIWPWVVYPARYEQVIAVAAHNCQKKPWSKSARGAGVDISAPGESVWRAHVFEDATKPYGVGMGSGTSFAVATAAGACALWLAYHGRKRLIKKYGATRLAAVFRELLLSEGFEKPPGWDSEKYGVGILRADRLLKARLPETAPAAGLIPMALRAPAARPGYLERLEDYFPFTDRSGLRNALARLLHGRAEELEHILELHGDEITFHMATDAALRSAIHRAASLRSPTASVLRPGGRSLLRANASRLLRRQMRLR